MEFQLTPEDTAINLRNLNRNIHVARRVIISSIRDGRHAVERLDYDFANSWSRDQAEELETHEEKERRIERERNLPEFCLQIGV